MLQPLSSKKRRVYRIVLFIIFLILAPYFILDARGVKFNISEYFKVYKTGGLYISTDQSGMAIYVDDKLVKETSIVQKSIFVQNLKPAEYTIRVSKEGLQTWNKKLNVYPEVVTEAKSFLIKSEPTILEISRMIDLKNPDATTSKNLSKNPSYDAAVLLFTKKATSTIDVKILKEFASTTATSTIDAKIFGDVLVKRVDDKLHVVWTGESDSIPNYFCENTICKKEIILNTNGKVLSYDFFPGRNDLLVVSIPTGVFVYEIDDRSTQNVQKIIEGAGYDFRIKDGKEIYLKNGDKFYTVAL